VGKGKESKTPYHPRRRREKQLYQRAVRRKKKLLERRRIYGVREDEVA